MSLLEKCSHGKARFSKESHDCVYCSISSNKTPGTRFTSCSGYSSLQTRVPVNRCRSALEKCIASPEMWAELHLVRGIGTDSCCDLVSGSLLISISRRQLTSRDVHLNVSICILLPLFPRGNNYSSTLECTRNSHHGVGIYFFSVRSNIAFSQTE